MEFPPFIGNSVILYERDLYKDWWMQSCKQDSVRDSLGTRQPLSKALWPKEEPFGMDFKAL